MSSELDGSDLAMRSLERSELDAADIKRAEAAGVPVDERYPKTWWIACLDVRSLPPTEQELRMLRSYIEYITRDLYNETWQRKILEAPLPICNGHNTITFYKDEASWRYRRSTWTIGPPMVPAFLGSDHWNLEQLLDHINDEWRASKWTQWKVQYPEIFESV